MPTSDRSITIPLKSVAEQLLQAIAMTVGHDPEDRRLRRRGGPHRAALCAVYQPVSSTLTAGERAPSATSQLVWARERGRRAGRSRRPRRPTAGARTAPGQARSCRGARRGCARSASRPQPASPARTASPYPAGRLARGLLATPTDTADDGCDAPRKHRDRRQLSHLVAPEPLQADCSCSLKLAPQPPHAAG